MKYFTTIDRWLGFCPDINLTEQNEGFAVSKGMLAPSRPQLYRCAIIHRLIKSGCYPNANRLAADLGVHHRTIMRDLEYMRDSLSAPSNTAPGGAAITTLRKTTPSTFSASPRGSLSPSFLAITCFASAAAPPTRSISPAPLPKYAPCSRIPFPSTSDLPIT